MASIVGGPPSNTDWSPLCFKSGKLLVDEDNFSKLAELFPGPSFALGGLAQKDFIIAKKNGAQGIAGITEFFSPQNGTNQKK